MLFILPVVLLPSGRFRIPRIPHTDFSLTSTALSICRSVFLNIFFRYCIIIVSIVLSVFILPVVLTSFPQASHAGSSFLWCSCSNVQAEECLHYTRRVHVTVLSCCLCILLCLSWSCCVCYLAAFHILMSLVSCFLCYLAVFDIVVSFLWRCLCYCWYCVVRCLSYRSVFAIALSLLLRCLWYGAVVAIGLAFLWRCLSY